MVMPLLFWAFCKTCQEKQHKITLKRLQTELTVTLQLMQRLRSQNGKRFYWKGFQETSMSQLLLQRIPLHNNQTSPIGLCQKHPQQMYQICHYHPNRVHSPNHFHLNSKLKPLPRQAFYHWPFFKTLCKKEWEFSTCPARRLRALHTRAPPSTLP